MGRNSCDKTAIFLVTTPPDFRPQRAWDIPRSFDGAVLYQKNLAVHEARQHARLFNSRAVQLATSPTHEWDHRWMIVTSHLRPYHGPKKGGAA